MHRFLPLLLTALLAPAFAQADASGSVTYKGKRWEVVDAIAAEEFFGRVKLSFAPAHWDRIAWADNNSFDMFDPRTFENDTRPQLLEILLDKDGTFSELEIVQTAGRGSLGKGEGRIAQAFGSQAPRFEGLAVEHFSPESVAGTLKFEQGDYAVDVKFDLAVIKKDARVDVPGSPLPANGGEPGKALLATLAAATAADVPTMLALAHPDRREQMTKDSATPEFAARLAMMKSMTPTGPSISGGKLHEDHAWLDFSGSSGGTEKKYSAKLSRVAGVWYVERLSTRKD